jgi:acetyl-CoA synthetase
LDDPATTAKFYRGDYFYPGDLAVRREDGRIRILGRTEDVINLKGWKVAVAPLEERLERALSVDTVCLFSELTEAGDYQVIVAIEADRPPSKDEIAAAVRDIPGFDRVRWGSLKAFPRTQAGMNKVDRRALRKLLG